MIRYLIKNNFKLMFRNKWVLFTMILGPVIVIACLSGAFADLMKSYEGVEAFRVGYRTEAGSMFTEGMEVIRTAGENAGMTFLEFPEGEPEEVMIHNELKAFVEFGVQTYTVYESADYPVEGMTLEYFLGKIMRTYTDHMLTEMAGMDSVLSEMSSRTNFLPAEISVVTDLPVKELEYLPAVSSIDYYGIIEIVYFTWVGIICAANILNNEKKYAIHRKFQAAALSEIRIYLGRWISVVSVVAVGIGIATGISIWLFDVHWGSPAVSCLLMLLTIMASISLGLFLYAVFDHIAITVVVLFVLVWFMGFFGGSFETYMYASWADGVKSLSPIYHLNRALVEHSAMGHSAYTGSAILYMAAITVICSVAALAVGRIRKRGRA